MHLRAQFSDVGACVRLGFGVLTEMESLWGFGVPVVSGLG